MQLTIFRKELNKILCKESGIGLLETIAALGLAVVVITSLVSLSVFTLRSSTRGKLLLTGSKIANDQVELIRAYRDSFDSWSDFINIVDDCETADPSCHMEVVGTTLGIQNGTAFTKDAQGNSTENTPLEVEYGFRVYDPINGDSVDTTDSVIRIEVEVRWKIGAEDKYSYIYTDISNWRSQ